MALLFGVRSSLLSHPVEIEAGTIMLFRQEVAPAGWTRDVASTLNNSALRVMTSGTWVDGKQGATAFNAVFGAGKSSAGMKLTGGQSGTSAHAHGSGSLAASGGGHSHTSHGHNSDAVDAYSGGNSAGSATGTGTGAGGTHGHTMSGSVANSSEANADDLHGHTLSLDLNFVDLILCSRDA